MTATAETARPHEFYWFDEVLMATEGKPTLAYAVVCSTCSEHIGVVTNIDDGSYLPLANTHWEEKVLTVWKKTNPTAERSKTRGEPDA